MRSNEMTNLSTLLRFPERFRRTRTRFVRRDVSSAETTKATTTPPVPATNDVTFSQNQSSSTTTTDDLPRAHVKRLMKHHLSQFTHVDSKTAQQFEPNIAKDALDGVQQACKIFIHYLTSTANDICTESKRSTLSAVRFVWVWWFFFRMDFEF